MANPEPIKQRIEADYKKKGFEDAARDTKALGEATQKAGEQAAQASPKIRTREQRLRELRERLVELVRAEDRHEREVSQGRRTDERATEASRRRQRQIERVGGALRNEQRIQERANAAVRGHTQSAGKLDGAIGGLATRFTAAAASLAGPAGLIAALRILGNDLEERTRQTRAFLDASLDLQFLSNTFNEQERDFVASASIFAGRDPSETFRAFTQLKSRFPTRSDEEIQGLFLKIAETGRTTEAPLTPITNALSGLFDVTGDAGVAQNILRETIIQAGQSDPAVISTLLGKTLGPFTTIGGQTAAQAAGTTAAVTGLTTQQPTEQVQGLLTLMLQLRGKGTPEAREILDREGIAAEADFLSQIESLGLAVQEGRISSSEFETVASREGIKIASALVDPQKRAAFFAKINEVVAAGADPANRTANAIASQFADDPLQSVNFAIKQAEARSKVATSQDQAALESELAGILLDTSLRQSGVNPVSRAISRGIFNTAASLGFSAESSAESAFLLTSESGGGDLDRAFTRDVLGGLETAREGGIINNTIINGTVINQGRGPNTADLDDGRPHP